MDKKLQFEQFNSYNLKIMAAEFIVDDQSVTITRNSPVRKLAGKPLDRFADCLRDRLPWLTPNMITLAGVGLVVTGVYVAEKQNRNPNGNFKKDMGVAMALQGLGYLCDGLDGPLARSRSRRWPGTNNFMLGQIIDASADRTEEIASGYLRAQTAYILGDRQGALRAIRATATNSLPSLARSLAEALGYANGEMGTNPLEASGTRFARIFMNTLATHFRELKGIKVQSLLDGYSAFANEMTAGSRLKPILDPNIKPDLPAIDRKKALARAAAMAGATLAGLIVTRSLEKQFKR